MGALLGGAGEHEEHGEHEASGADGAVGASPASVARLLGEGTLLLTFHSGKPIAEAGPEDMTGTSVKLIGAHETLSETRTIGDEVYSRINAGALYGPEGAARMREQLAGSPMGESYGRYLDGEWLHMSARPAATARGGAAAPDGEERGELLDSLRKVAAQEVRFRDGGHRNGAEIITAEASPRALVTALLDELGDADALSGLLEEQLQVPADELMPRDGLDELPDDVVGLDLSVRHGVLSGLSLDLSQFAPPAGSGHSAEAAGETGGEAHGASQELLLDVEFDEAHHPVVAPEDATELSMEKLPAV